MQNNSFEQTIYNTHKNWLWSDYLEFNWVGTSINNCKAKHSFSLLWNISFKVSCCGSSLERLYSKEKEIQRLKYLSLTLNILFILGFCFNDRACSTRFQSGLWLARSEKSANRMYYVWNLVKTLHFLIHENKSSSNTILKETPKEGHLASRKLFHFEVYFSNILSYFLFLQSIQILNVILLFFFLSEYFHLKYHCVVSHS